MNDRLNNYLFELDAARRAKAVSNSCAERLEDVARREHAKFNTTPKAPYPQADKLLSMAELAAITGLRVNEITGAFNKGGAMAPRQPGERFRRLSPRGMRLGVQKTERSAALWYQRAAIEFIHKQILRTKTR